MCSAKVANILQILILDYDLIQDSEFFHNRYMLYDAKAKSLFTKVIEIHTLELQKLPPEADDAQIDKKTEQEILWLKLIRAQEEEEVKMLAAKSPEIKEAYAVLKKISEDEEVRLRYESREKAIWDEQARLYGARKEGEHQNAIDTARKSLERGLDVDLIAFITGLTVEEVQSLQNQPSSVGDVIASRMKE